MFSKQKQLWLILIALSLAIFTAAFIDKQTTWLGFSVYKVLEVVGTLFLHALTLIVVPLVSSSIITAVAKISSESSFGRLGGKIFAVFALINMIAVAIGFFVVIFFTPGTGLRTKIALFTEQKVLISSKANAFSTLILEIIPPNILDAFAKGNMLALIFFSILFGHALTKIHKESFQTHLQFWKGIFEAMLKIVHGIMKFLPIGVFCLTAKVFLDFGLETLAPLAKFIWTALLALAIFAFGALPLLLKFLGKVSVRKYYISIFPALITAFSTSSSSATLPIALDCMEKKAGISHRICSLVLPLGTTLNLAGTALYNTFAGLFLAQVFGISFTFTEQIMYVFTALVISFGIASIPGGSLIAILTLLRIMEVPTEGIGILMALDRLIDMFRTSVNLFSYTTSTTLIAKSEKEKILTKTSSVF